MKKLSLKWKLTILSSSIVAVTSFVIYILLGITTVSEMNKIQKAVMDNMDNIEPKELKGAIMIVPDLSSIFYNGKSLFWLKSFGITVIVVVIAGFVTYKLVERFLEPKTDLKNRMKEVNVQNLSKQIEVKETGDEIEEITVSFNDMIIRLSRLFGEEKSFLQNAAHELRTPLAVLKTKIDVFKKNENNSIEDYKKMLASVTEYNDRMSHMVQMLLQIQESQTIERKDEINIYDLIDEVIMDLSIYIDEKHLSVSEEGDNPQIIGSDLLMYRVFYNLLENAIKYNVDGGYINILIKDNMDDVIIKIEDSGCGIESEKKKIFEAFYRERRAGNESNGVGLGLHLVKKILELHSGRIEVKDGEKVGTQFIVTIPKNNK